LTALRALTVSLCSTCLYCYASWRLRCAQPVYIAGARL